MKAADFEKVLHGSFARYAEAEGLSMEGEASAKGFVFYSMETKRAFNAYITGYVDGKINQAAS